MSDSPRSNEQRDMLLKAYTCERKGRGVCVLRRAVIDTANQDLPRVIVWRHNVTCADDVGIVCCRCLLSVLLLELHAQSVCSAKTEQCLVHYRLYVPRDVALVLTH